MSDAATKSRTHGKSRTAADTANARRTWRETVRKGERVLIGPDGRMYLGTAKEVRDAALTPAIRDELAGRLRWIRYVEAGSRYTTEGRRDAMRCARRHAISRCASDGGSSILSVRMGESLRMLMTAGARLAGNTLDEYLAGMFRREIDALLDAAEARTGRREIPLTRHERAAMERLRTASPVAGGMV